MRRALLLLLASFPAFLFAQTSALVGYLPQWGIYGTPPWSAQQLVANGTAAMLTQIDYSQAFIVNGRCSVADPNADLGHAYTAQTSVDGTADAPATPGSAPVLRGEFHQLQELHRRYPRMRMLISIEGKAAAFADAAQPEKRAAFAASCIDMFLRGNLAPGLQAPDLFTGIDVDWEYPNGAGDGANFTALVAEFRRQLDAYAAVVHGEKPMLTIAAAPGLARYPGVDWSAVARAVDQIGLMNYDYNGPWQKMTGIVAPLYAMPGLRLESGNIDATIANYENAGVPAAKLLLGVPFYGYHWSHVTDAGAQHGLGITGQQERGDTPYREIAALPGARTPFRDAHSGAPWLYDGSTFWTYDDPISAAAKASYARNHGLGGMMIWELSGDTADGSMVRAMCDGLGGNSCARPRTSAASRGPASPDHASSQ